MSEKKFVYEFRVRRVRRSVASEKGTPLMSKLYGLREATMVFRYMLHDAHREHFMVAYLNAQNQLVGYEVVAVGTGIGVDVHPSEVFRGAILASAVAIVVCHNHPSGNCSPSDDDNALTMRLAEASRLLGIPLLDHLIIGDREVYSYADHQPNRLK